jgi:Uma2 family endonuclease
MAGKSIEYPDLEVLLRSPRLAILREKIGLVLDEEQHKREQFYETITEDQKAEFINGEIVVQSPAKLHHTQGVGYLYTLLRAFVEAHGMGVVGHEKMLIALSRNDYEPDVCYFAEDKARLFTGDQMKFPAPDFIVEVLSPSTEQVDRTIKFDDYAAHGVTEYWIVDPEAQTAEQYVLHSDRYELMTKAKTGTIASVAVVGFEIPIRAIFDRDENLRVLRDLLA